MYLLVVAPLALRVSVFQGEGIGRQIVSQDLNLKNKTA